jgi:hypothetical protein
MDDLVMGECEDKQRKSCNTKTNCKHSKGGYGRLPLNNVYTCDGFFQKVCKFEKTRSKTLFHKFTQRFVDRRFNNLWKPTINKIFETQKTTICNSKQVNLVAIGFKEQSFKTTDESTNDRAGP